MYRPANPLWLYFGNILTASTGALTLSRSLIRLGYLAAPQICARAKMPAALWARRVNAVLTYGQCFRHTVLPRPSGVPREGKPSCPQAQLMDRCHPQKATAAIWAKQNAVRIEVCTLRSSFPLFSHPAPPSRPSNKSARALPLSKPTTRKKVVPGTR